MTTNDRHVLCARLAHDSPCAAALNSQARQAAAARAWAAISRFSTNCREQRPGKKGSPRFQRECRSVEYQQTGWQLDGVGKRLILTDGCGIGQVRLIGSRELATFPREQITRVRRLRRADGSSAQFVLQGQRRVSHVPTGAALGSDVGIAASLTDAEGQAVANPRFLRLAEARRQRSPRRLSRRSLQHKQGKQPRNSHAARQRARQHQYPKNPAAPAIAAPSSPSSPPPTPAAPSLQRQREDYARKTARALISSHDFIAWEDLQVRKLVRTRCLAKAISDVGWARLRRWWRTMAGCTGFPWWRRHRSTPARIVAASCPMGLRAHSAG